MSSFVDCVSLALESPLGVVIFAFIYYYYYFFVLFHIIHDITIYLKLLKQWSSCLHKKVSGFVTVTDCFSTCLLNCVKHSNRISKCLHQRVYRLSTMSLQESTSLEKTGYLQENIRKQLKFPTE